MTKEIGPREKALRAQREAKYDNRFPEVDRAGLKKAVAIATGKRGKPRKAKK